MSKFKAVTFLCHFLISGQLVSKQFLTRMEKIKPGGDDKTLSSELSLISHSVLRMGTACSFHQRQKICFVSKVNGECPHLQFLSKLTILIYGKKLLQRVPLYHSLGCIVG